MSLNDYPVHGITTVVGHNGEAVNRFGLVGRDLGRFGVSLGVKRASRSADLPPVFVPILMIGQAPRSTV